MVQFSSLEPVNLAIVVSPTERPKSWVNLAVWQSADAAVLTNRFSYFHFYQQQKYRHFALNAKTVHYFVDNGVYSGYHLARHFPHRVLNHKNPWGFVQTVVQNLQYPRQPWQGYQSALTLQYSYHQNVSPFQIGECEFVGD